MKKVNIGITAIAITGLSLGMVACGSGEKTLETLKKEKKELTTKIKVLDSLILEIDTTKMDIFYPLIVAQPIVKKNFEHSIEVLGTVSSDKNIVLSAEYNGKITSIRVKEGQNVKKGQTIAVIDGQALSDNATELNTQLEYAQYMLDKQNQLKAKGVGSEFNVRQAENQVNSLKNQIKSLSTARGKTIVRAPFTGVVEEIMPKEGEFVGAGSQIARVVNVDKITITSEVSEQLLGNLKEGKDGTQLSMKFDHSDTPIVTTIHSIGKYINPINRTVKIRTNIDNNKSLLPNMTGKIAITDASIENANVISSKAILKDDKNNDFIYVLGEKNANDGYTVSKVYINEISSFQGQSAISSKESLDGKEVIVQGARGISEKDIVKLKIVTNE